MWPFSRKKKSKQANPEIRITRQGLLSSYLKYAQWVKRNMFIIERKSINLSR